MAYAFPVAKTGEYTALKEDAQLASSVPQCPMCREPVRQYVTQRYNRVVNRAVIDEMSKRFVVSGKQELQALEKKLQTVGEGLKTSRSALLPATSVTYSNTFRENMAAQGVAKKLDARYVKAGHLEKDVRSFLRKTNENHKPSHKLHDAIVHAASKQLNINEAFGKMSFSPVATSIKQDRDQRITLAGRLYHLKVRQLVLDDKFEVLEAFKACFPTATLDFPGGLPVDRSRSFLRDCLELIKDCKQANSPRCAVEASLYYAHATRLLMSTGLNKGIEGPKIMQYRESAIGLLKEAEKLCESAFQDRDQLQEGIERSFELLGREFYQKVSREEVEAIKRAMVSGRGGIGSHSGHWYNCLNGHPVSLCLESGLASADHHSLLLANVACQCSLLVVQNAAPLLEAEITRLLLGSLARRTWRIKTERMSSLRICEN
jgi:hypothetical protein